MTNRDRPASTQTKREKAAERYAGILLAANPDRGIDDLVAHAVTIADALYDELDTPTELRGEPDERLGVWNDYSHALTDAVKPLFDAMAKPRDEADFDHGGTP